MYSDDPVLRWLSIPEIWVLEEPFKVTWKGRTWTIPKGFRTDLASIPRFFQRLITKNERHVQAAIVHDWFYVYGGITKEEADQMFLDGMAHLGVSWWKRHAMYRAVRIGGRGIWG